MKKVLVLLMIMIVTITFSSCVRTDNNIEKYADDVENYYAGLFMPDLEDIGDYKEISYFSRKDESIFPLSEHKSKKTFVLFRGRRFSFSTPHIFLESAHNTKKRGW